MKTLRSTWLIIAILLCAQLPLCGQEARGTILGRVSDPSGAVIAGAKVEALNAATGVRTDTATNESGDYLLPFMIPGPYTIAVEVPGFKRFVRSAINLRVDDRITVDVSMTLGQAAESVEVVGTATLLDTSTTSMGQVMDAKTILELPLKDGNLIWAVTLSPGVTDTNTAAGYVRPFDTSHPTAISVGGTRTGSNQYTIDGAPNMQRQEFAYSPPPGVVEEFKVLGTSFDASYGYMAGAAVNMSLKSGTNKVHGQLYEFHQSPTLGANQFFANRGGTPRVGYRLHRWGANASGPVYLPKVLDGRNKTFWMFGYEGIRSWDPSSGGIESVPSDAQRRGDFSALLKLGSQYQIYDPFTIAPASGGRFSISPLAGNIIPPSKIGPLSSNIAKLWDQPNLPGTADGTNNFTFGKNSHDAYYNYIGRVDHNLSSKQRFYVRSNATLNTRPQHWRHNGAEGWTLRRRNAGAAADHVYTVSPTFFINSRYSLTYYVPSYVPVDMGFNLAGLGFSSAYINQINQVNPLGLRLPVINAAGYSIFATQYNLQAVHDATHDFGLNAPLIVRAHTLRFGAGYRVSRENTSNLDKSSGTFSFATNWTRGPFNTSGAAPMGQSLASLLYGLPTSGAFPMVDNYAEQAKTWAFYLQDDWKISTKLTLSAGLRYELSGPLTERFNRSVQGFDFSSSSPLEAQAKANYAANPIPQVPVSQFQVKGGLTFAGVNGAPRGLWNTPRTNLMPRIGFAYSITPNLVLRGGAGIFYEPIGVVSVHVNQTGFSRATSMTPTVDNGVNFIATLTNPFPNGFLQPLKAAGGLSTNLGAGVNSYDQAIKNPYMERWQFAVQRGLPGNAVLEVSYVGNRGVRQRLNRNYAALPNQYLSTLPVRDQPAIDFLSAAVPNPFYPLLPGTNLSGTTVSRAQLLQPYPHFTGVSRDENQGYSWYHSMQVRLEKRFASGLSTSVAYTWSKLMDATGFKNAGDPLPEEVISASDRTQRLVVTWIYALPLGRGKRWASSTPVLSTLIGGWQLQGVYQGQSGPPLGFGDAIFTGDLKSVSLPGNQRTVDRWFNVDAGFERSSAKALASHLRAISTRFGGIRGDGINQFDLSVLKNTRLKEGVNLELRAEANNALNHAQFNIPNTTPSSTAFGRVTAEFSMPRTTQIALKLVF
jgi:hypothetical protein